MAGNPVTYAEETLGVHSVWEEAQRRLTHHERLVTERAESLISLRKLRTQITDRESDITAAAPETWPEANSTERGRLIKVAIHADAALQDLRAEEDDLQATLDMIDADIRHHESGIRVLAARMEELGGLLHFYSTARSK